jgi:hypothetical protein
MQVALSIHYALVDALRFGEGIEEFGARVLCAKWILVARGCDSLTRMGHGPFVPIAYFGEWLVGNKGNQSTP